MLQVISLSEAETLLLSRFGRLRTSVETVPLPQAAGRFLYADVTAEGDVPGFTRATVDGYGVRAGDTFGCSPTLPALLPCMGGVEMGKAPSFSLLPGRCAAVPTGGALPEGADAMVMLEYTELLPGDTVAVEKPAAPGQHLIFAGDDVKAGERIFSGGTRLGAQDIGALAAMGIPRVKVYRRPKVAILSTGDEVVPPDTVPGPGQIRDVNGPLLAAQCAAAGGESISFGILPDREDALEQAILDAVAQADMVLLSGGSSVGEKDAAARVLERNGKLLFHGLSLRPGKPAMAGDVGGTPVFGLPGHPLAAFFLCRLLCLPLLRSMMNAAFRPRQVSAVLDTAVPNNQGRESLIPVRLRGNIATPLITKSGLISVLATADGFLRIPREREGLQAGQEAPVYLWEEEEHEGI